MSTSASSRCALGPIDADQVSGLAKDAMFVTIGFAVLGFQRAQVRRRELTERLQGGPDTSIAGVGDLLRVIEVGYTVVDDAVSALEEALKPVLDQVQRRLPDPADRLLARARTTARTARRHARGLVVGMPA